jgi:hypothetical protein
MFDCAMTIDVEWAHPEVLADLCSLLDRHAVRATFFCTHPGIELGRHEGALHPNFRRCGDGMQNALRALGPGASETALQRRVLGQLSSWYPQARGVRAHSLFYDSSLLPLYAACGIAYDSSYCLFLKDNLAPAWKECAILELPVYYMDHLDLLQEATRFELANIPLALPGLKIFDFHPNLVYINAESTDHYAASKAVYGDPAALRRLRHGGRGVRSLFVELIETLSQRTDWLTLSELHAAWLAGHPYPYRTYVDAGAGS